MKPQKNKYRSKSEERVAKQLESLEVQYEYEKLKVPYQRKPSKYLADFQLPNGIIIEVKGRLVASDRAKHLLIKDQHPDLDIRFCFDNANRFLYKGSKTTYGGWATKHGFLWCVKVIPEEWIKEGTR